MKDKTIFVADDHTLFREGIVRILETLGGYRVIGTAANGAEAEEQILSRAPDIAILDISMPRKSGIEVAKALQGAGSRCLTVILTMYTEEGYLEQAMQSGVKGYLLKDSTIEEISLCLAAITEGKYYVSAKLTDYLVQHLHYKKAAGQIAALLQKLSPAEQQVLRLLAQKKTSTQIAEEIFISYRTVQKHRQNISAKLDLQGYNRLVFFATENRKEIEALPG